MAERKIVWTEKANTERQKVLEYWIERNKSKTYSIKLNRLIIQLLRQLAENPSIGRKTSVANVRVTIVRNYLLFYEYSSKEVKILTLWDGRRDEKTLKMPE